MRKRLLIILMLVVSITLFTHQPLVLAQDYFPHPACQAMTDVYNFVFSPDGKYLVAVGESTVAQVWDVQTGEFVRYLPHMPYSLERNGRAIRNVAYSPDGKYIATSRDHDAVLWDAETRKRLYEFAGDTVWGLKIIFTQDSKYLLIGDIHGGVLWDVQTGQRGISFSDWVGDEQGKLTVQLSSNGDYVLTNGINNITIWDVHHGHILQAISSDDVGFSVREPYTGTFTPDGKVLIIDKENQKAIWDLNTQKEIKSVPATGNIRAISRNGKYMLVFTQEYDEVKGFLYYYNEIWDLQNGKQLLKIPIYDYPYGYFLPDSQHIAVHDDEMSGLYKVWDIESGKVTKTFYMGRNNAIAQLVSSPNGKYVAVEHGVSGGVLELWDATTLEKVQEYCTLGEF
jgi:WD40 repeat protein